MTNIELAKKFSLNAGLVFIGSIIVMFIGILINTILGRSLGATGLGLYTLVLVFYGILTLIGEFGLPMAIIRYVAEFKDNKEELNKIVSCGVINSIIFGFLILIILYTTSDILAQIYSKPKLSSLLKIISIIFPFFFISDALLFFLNGLKKIKLYSLFLILRRLLILLFTIFFLEWGWNVEGAVIALVISSVVASTILLIYLKSLIIFTFQDYVSNTKILLNFGVKILLAGSVNLINTTAGTLLIGYFLLDKDVGIYAIATMFANLFLMIPNSIDTIVYPTVSEFNNPKNIHKSLGNMINKIIKYSFIILSLLAIFIIIFSKEVIILLFPNRPEFLLARPAIMILLFGMMIYGSIGSVGSTFSGMNRPDIPLKVSLIAAISNLFFNIMLIPKLGINGAAIATAISLSIFAISEIYFMNSILKIKIEINQFFKIFAAFIVIYFIIIYFDNYANNIIINILGMLLYIVILYYSKIINYDDKNFILSILKIAK